MRTAADVFHRLEESGRIRLAYLDAWPDEPHFEMTHSPYKSPQNCVSRVAAGLFHDDSHLEQIAEIVRQAKAARTHLVHRKQTNLSPSLRATTEGRTTGESFSEAIPN